ncbi:tetratricopeptide repeat protein [Streptomyces sp. NPDC091279]|uniref:AfsR/SARP family transcriptional regulator n=1 Tax=Streptomyces sp. NPDC091279 TaxID=3365983 RepID=UPI00381F06F3
MEFAIRLSGSVEVRAADRSNDLGSAKTRIVLAVLAWEAGRTVSMDTLVHRVWDEKPPAKAREALHVHVSRVRGALRIAEADAPTLRSRTNAYVLDVDPDRVDLRCYTHCVDQARSLKDSGDTAEALRLLDRAAEFWHGEPLAGITGSWPDHLRATVLEKSHAAAVARAELLMLTGKFDDAVPVLTPLAAERPSDEALAERLAVALHGSNRTADATKLLQRTRQRVVRDIGLDAGRRLRHVHQGILSGTPAAALLRHTGAGQGTPTAPTPGVPDNLPRDVPWVGRREEVRRLASALCEDGGGAAPVVTVEAIDGMSGVGKTSLAVHLVHQLRDMFPDGRLFLNLGGQAADRTMLTPARALTELLRLLGLPADEVPHETAELVALWRSVTRDRRMVVILDDAADADQVRQLLPGASPTAVVVTSRRRLTGLPGVRPVSLDVLPTDDAAALFLQRLGTRHGTRQTDVEEIVRMCGHLPLAIEIAASRLLAHPSWTTADLLKQLSGHAGQLNALRDGERSMSHVLALSYRALDPVQRLVFRRAGLHFGAEFGPEAVAALAGLPTERAEDVLEQLLVRHLVFEPTPHRYAMHDLLRVYARSLTGKGTSSNSAPSLESLEGEAAGFTDSAEESDRAIERLIDHYLMAVDHADRLAYPIRSRMTIDDLSSTEQPEMTTRRTAEQWLLTEKANLLDLLDQVTRHRDEHQLALSVHVLAGFLDTEGHLVAAEPLLRRAVAHWASTGDNAARARALLDLSTVHTRSARFEDAIEAAQKALEAARLLRDTELEVECIHRLSVALWQTGQYATAQALQKQALSSLEQTTGGLRLARVRNLLGITHLHLGENREAIDCLRSALVAFEEIGDDRGRYSALNNLGETLRKTGDPKAAEKYYREAIQLAASMSGKGDHATLRMNLASVLDMQGKTEEALSLYGEVLPVLRAVEDVRGESIALNRIGRAHRAAGRSEGALPHHVAALALARRIQAQGEEVDALYELALAEEDTGRVAQAMTHLKESLAVSRRIGAPAEAERASSALARLRATGGVRGD